jgi:hypothetical protein
LAERGKEGFEEFKNFVKETYEFEKKFELDFSNKIWPEIVFCEGFEAAGGGEDE